MSAEPDPKHARSISLQRGLALLSILLAAAVVGLFVELERARSPVVVPGTATPEPPRLGLEPAEIADLAGWDEDPLDGLARALARSCAVQAKKARVAPAPSSAPAPTSVPAPSGEPVAAAIAARGGGLAGAPEDWSRVCALAAAALDPAALRQVLTAELRPWSVRDWDRDQALLTGYYEPLLHGSLRRSERFSVPLYLRPPELVEVDLGVFRDDLRGRRLAGIVRGGRLMPFADRDGLERGALDGRGLELVWVDDAIDAFFLHIQGSGRVDLDDGTQLRVGYAAQNGHSYVAIGKELVARGAMPLEDVTMQSIRAWLESHPAEAVAVMRKNPSFVFFRKLDEGGPVGSQGVVLEPHRSIAVDPSFLPLGLPVWLDGSWPAPQPGEPDRPLRRLVVAQDTGGAIRGPLRADLFCGHGAEAAEVAGRLKHAARMWVFLPRHLTP